MRQKTLFQFSKNKIVFQINEKYFLFIVLFTCLASHFLKCSLSICLNLFEINFFELTARDHNKSKKSNFYYSNKINNFNKSTKIEQMKTLIKLFVSILMSFQSRMKQKPFVTNTAVVGKVSCVFINFVGF